ncbi:MAG: DUF309 domain-containing protein [Dehalococcoidia bacterium]
MAQAPLRNQPLLDAGEVTARLSELYRAIDEFNAGWYFESHETLEEFWMVTPWPERQFFQGIIQLAAAFVHVARREYPGIIKLLDLALDKLRQFSPGIFGVGVAVLIADVERARGDFASLGPERFLEYDETRTPKIRYSRIA